MGIRSDSEHYHAEMSAHRNHLPLHVPQHYVPATLIDAERCLAVGPRIHVRGRDDVRRRVANPEVKNLALLDKNMHRVHYFFYRSSPVPPRAQSVIRVLQTHSLATYQCRYNMSMKSVCSFSSESRTLMCKDLRWLPV